MKPIIYFLLLTCSLSTNAYSQDEPFVFHYPLNIGDLWEYRRSPGFLVTRKVIGDTMLANGKTYRMLEDTAPEGSSISFQRVIDSVGVFQFYERIDSSGQRIPDESLLYKLNVKEGDSWTIPSSDGSDTTTFQVTHIADTTLWSNKFKFFTFFSPKAFGMEFIIVDSLGIFFEGFEGGELELQGAIIDDQQFGTITSIRPSENTSIENNLFLDNYPNPFNDSTTIEYLLRESARVRISIFNVLGERVKLLTDSFQTPGTYRVNWSGDNESGRTVSSGVYFYVIQINNTVTARKSVLFLK